MKNVFLTCSIVLTAITLLSSSSNTPYETRCTWLIASSIDSEKKIKKNIKKIIKSNLNTVFLSIPKTANNFGYGKEKFFSSFLKLAYRNGLSVHAWFVNGRRLGRRDHVNFSDEDEQQKQILWISYFLKKYNEYLDGVHLDYIRIEKGAPVNLDKMNGIRDTISGIRKFMKINYPGKFLTTSVFSASAVFIKPFNTSFVWNQYIPDWFKRWVKLNSYSQYKKFKNDVERIGTPAFMIYQQDPINWVKTGLIDAIIPMQYTKLDNKWKDEVIQFRSFFKYAEIKDKHLFMGLGWIPKRNERSTRGYDAPGIVRKIKYGRKNNIKGFMIFILSNHGFDDSPLIKALTVPGKDNNFDPPFSKRAISLISRYNKTKR